MTPRKLHNPYPGAIYLARGGGGHLFRIPRTAIAVKIPHRVVNGSAEDDAQATESLETLRREIIIYELLTTKPQHPNILQYYVATESAIFTRFEPETLERRLERRREARVPQARQLRWAKEISSASAWLEGFDFFHGDLAPESVFLDAAEHVKLGHFGRALERGCKIETAAAPFYRPSKDAVAGPAHEQFAIGSCLYTIRNGERPYGRCTTPAESKRMHEALLKGEFPQTDHDAILGHIISSCWQGRYKSIKDVADAVCMALGMVNHKDTAATALPLEDSIAGMQISMDFVFKQERNQT